MQILITKGLTKHRMELLKKAKTILVLIIFGQMLL